jgi:mevalonate kinase
VARAKLLLFGEHAAVYGHPAVGYSLPWPLTVVHSPGPWEFPGLGPYEPAVRSLVDWLVNVARQEGLPAPVPGRLEFITKIPVAAGYGSSGALCAVLVNLFFGSLPLADRERLAWRAEGRFHGTPSGIDTALALREGWWALDASTKPAKAAPLGDPRLVLVTGALVRRSDTRALVASVAARRAAGDAGATRALDELGAVAAEAVAGWKAHDAPRLAALVTRARAGLQSLDLETPELTGVLEAALACPGALAGKLSGAGGGGAFLVLFDRREAAVAALSAVEAAVPEVQWAAKPLLV